MQNNYEPFSPPQVAANRSVHTPYCVAGSKNIRQNHDYTFYLSQYVSNDIRHYVELLEVLNSAVDGDTVTIMINGYGGDLYTSMQIMGAIRSSLAIVTTIVTGNANSGHAMIWLSGDILDYQLGAAVMFHTLSGGTYGKGYDAPNGGTVNNLQVRIALEEYGAGFFSESDINIMTQYNKDLWFVDYPNDVPHLDNTCIKTCEELDLAINRLYLVRCSLPKELQKPSMVYDKEAIASFINTFSKKETQTDSEVDSSLTEE